MRETLKVLVGVLIVVLVVFIATCVLVGMKDYSDFNVAQTNLKYQVGLIDSQATEKFGIGWMELAKEYIRPFELDPLHEQFAQISESSPERRIKYGALAHESQSRIRTAIRYQLEKKNNRPTTEDEIDSQLRNNPVAQHLEAIREARYAIRVLHPQIDSAKSLKDLEKVRSEFEIKKAGLQKLL